MERLLEIAEDGIITGEFDKALDVLNKIIDKEPSERAYFLRGYLHYCKYEYEKAIPELEFVISQYPENDEAYYYLSQMYSMQENYTKAKEYIEKAVEFDEENIEYLGDYVSVEQALKNFEHCVELCGRILEDTPDSNFALNARGYAYMQLGDIEAAITDFKKNTKENPMDFLGWNHLGVAYMKGGKFKDAKTAYQNAQRYNPAFSDSYSNMGYLFFKEGNMDKAFLYINKAIELDPASADAFKKRAELHISAGDKSEARKDLVKSDELGYSIYFDDEVESMLKNLDA